MIGRPERSEGPALRRRTIIIGAAMLLACATPARAHRLDEYLQATTIAVATDRVTLEISLTPGVAAFPSVLAAMDTNGDGLLSDVERRAYADRVLRDLSLSIDGDRLVLHLMSAKFASVVEMKEGRGDIVIDVDALSPPSAGERRLAFENRHLRAMSVYLVNALASRDPDIRLAHQSRNYEQSTYEMHYLQAGVVGESRGGVPVWLGAGALIAMAPLALLFVTRNRPFVTRG
jgi:hypothetical protein